jgi:glycine oxidase
MKSSDVVIVGGGAVGCATAYFLSKAGAKVTVIEKNRIAFGASGYAMGLLSPLYGMGIPGPLEGLSLNGFLMHRELAAELPDATGVDYHAHPHDSIYLSLSDEDEAGLQDIASYSGNVDGVSYQWLKGQQLKAIEPRLTPAAERGMLVRGTWVLEADKYTEALAEGARLNGTTFLDWAVTGLTRRSQGAVVQTNQGDIEADAVILAMGPWTGDAEKWLGVPIPVGPLKGQIVRMNIGGPPVTCSVHYASNYAGQKADGLTWIGTTEERVGFDNEPTQEARERIIREVGEFFPPALTGKVVHQTACLRPVAPDGLPVIGPVPGWEGVYLSTGAGRKGIILSPSMGKLTADMALDSGDEMAIATFSPDRFSSIAPC